MKAQILDSHEPLTVDRLKVAEARLGMKLPQSYREFLLRHNGGRPVPDTFDFTTSDGELQRSGVHFFSGISDESYELEQRAEVLKGRIPNKMLPIGGDHVGNSICICCSGRDVGKIYFWDHELEHLGADEATSYCADSLDEFLGGLYEFDLEEWERENPGR